jgi:hypothetical protein
MQWYKEQCSASDNCFYNVVLLCGITLIRMIMTDTKLLISIAKSYAEQCTLNNDCIYRFSN